MFKEKETGPSQWEEMDILKTDLEKICNQTCFCGYILYAICYAGGCMFL
jgi:hypothetical protein